MRFKAYKSDRGYGFSMLLKSKRQDGSEIKMYLPVGFKKGDEPSDTVYLDATDYFLTCYETKTGEVRPKLFVMSWLGITENKPIEAEYTEKEPAMYNGVWDDLGIPGQKEPEPVIPEVDYDDLPF